MTPQKNKVIVAVAQVGSVIMNKTACIEKVREWTKKAAQKEAKVVLFPEAFISAYPWGLNFGARIGNRSEAGKKDFARYWRSAIRVNSSDTEELGTIAKENSVYLIVGVIERDDRKNGGTLYCTILYFSPEGEFLGKHRKIKPTGSERVIWGEGDGSTLTVIDSPFGKIGGLICWENYMPLARTAMYQKGIDIYVAPTADAREQWQVTIRHIALEGRCFVLACNQFLTKEQYPTDLECYDELTEEPDILSRGGSAIIDPAGNYLAGPLYDEEGLLVAELDPEAIARGRYELDVVGHYSRPDIFKLVVNEK
jgi:nitrilase